MKYKMGRMTKVEIQTIEDNINHKNYVDIALLLNRDPETIKNYIETKLGVKTSLGGGKPVVMKKTHEVTEKEFWPILNTQFTPPELEVFIYHWDKLQKQFDYDILPTEELQIIDLIKFEIMMNRNLKQQRETEDSIKRIQCELEMQRVDPEPNRISDLERQLVCYQTGTSALSKEYRELQTQKNKLFEGLKATRADRIKRIDSKKESFISWIQVLIDKPEFRKKLGLYTEKFRLAMIDEKIRLMALHKYEDGKLDHPIFNEDIDESESD